MASVAAPIWDAFGPYSAALGSALTACSASCTTDIVRNRLAALTLIESMPSSVRNRAISG
jgi:hypothetical protein